MLVLIVHPGAELYGADRVTLESATGLVSAGHDVIAALPESGPLVSALEERGVRVIVSPMFVLRKQLLHPRRWPRLIGSAVSGFIGSWRLVSRLRPDAAYVSTVILPQWPVLLRLRRVATVTHVHEAESASPWALRAFLYIPQLWAHVVVANSRFTADLMGRSLPLLGQKIRVILNPIPGPSDVSAPRSHMDGIRLGYVGRLSPRKAPDAVIAALALLRARGRDARLEIIGDVFRGYEWYAAELEQQIIASGLTESVTMHGYDVDVWPHLAACDVMVVPSRTDESFGNTAVEAVLAQRAIIASDISGLREAVSDYPTSRVVAPGDPSAIAGAVEDLERRWSDVVRDAPVAAATASARHSVTGYHHRVVTAVESAMARRIHGFRADSPA